MWDDEDIEFARTQIIALGKAIHSQCCVYADFPSAMQALALTELVGELTKSVRFFEEDRVAASGKEAVQ